MIFNFGFFRFFYFSSRSVVVIVTGTEYFPLVLSPTILNNIHSDPSKVLLVGVGEPSGDNDTDDVGETGEKGRNILFITHCFGEEERFILALFTGDKPFVTFFLVVLVDADLEVFY